MNRNDMNIVLATVIHDNPPRLGVLKAVSDSGTAALVLWDGWTGSEWVDVGELTFVQNVFLDGMVHMSATVQELLADSIARDRPMRTKYLQDRLTAINLILEATKQGGTYHGS